MDLNVWLNEFYPKIIRDFGFDIERDRKSARVMYEIGRDKLLDSSVLHEVIENRDTVVIGGAVKEIDLGSLEDHVIITAGKSILKLNIIPDVHVTDMEEDDEVLVNLERKGCILVLHAHGDNISRVRSLVPKLNRFVATTQAEPFDKIYNFGGFTDGDRAAIIAKEFNAKSIKLIGFDFKNASGLKLKKLMWAKRILEFEGFNL